MRNKKQLNYNVIGLMSGTSLDGVDVVFCKFSDKGSVWNYKIVAAETIPYSLLWKNTLLSLEQTDALHFQQIHLEYGFYLGHLVKEFIKKHRVKPDFIASHGHTIFHADFNTHLLKDKQSKETVKKLTVQIGAGYAIAAQTGITTICDFRTTDAALGGQGAPLVPIGDKYLFSAYDFCLNLGGFANVSYEHRQKRIAYDVCPVNIVLNEICKTIGKDYDAEGKIASEGKLNLSLLHRLNRLPFYQLAANSPKSLGKEWVIENIYPLLSTYKLSPADAMATVIEHAAMQIAAALNKKKKGRLLVTGGGVYNKHLLNRITYHCKHQIIVPPASTIEFKEALIFAFLGVLRMRNENNCLKSVTGAVRDNIGGAVYAG